jgi:thiol-disulfide isomerase/thioredoxin
MPARRLSLAPAVLAALLTGCAVKVPKPADARPSTPTAPMDPGAAVGSTQTQAKPGGGTPGRTAAKAVPKAEVDALMARTRTALGAGNLPEASRALGELLSLDPNNRQALLLLAQVAQNEARLVPRAQSVPFFLRSAEAMRRIAALKTELTAEEKVYLPLALYNEACALAISGESARAIKALSEASDAGFLNAAHVDSDPDLDPIRRLPEFREVQRALERRSARALLAANAPFKLDFRLPGLDGKPVALADLKGKVTVVGFWGTWCLPCRKEVPHLVELARRYGEKGLRVVGLAYEGDDAGKARDLVRAFVKDHGINYPCLIGDAATREKVPHFEGYPTTLLLDETGTVRLRLAGYQSFAALEAAVEALLGEVKEEPKAASKG